MNKKNKIIFLSAVNFIKGDEEKYGFAEYLKSKTIIEIWYLNKIIDRNYKLKHSLHINRNIKIRNIFSTDNFIQLLNDVSNKRAIYYLRFTYNFKSKKIFQILSSCNSNYLYSQGPISHTQTPKYSSKKKYFTLKIKQLFKYKLNFLAKIFLNKYFLSINPKYFGIKEAPYLYLKGQSPAPIKRHKLYGKKTKVIWGHHRDYDKYLKIKKDKPHKKKILLFIDQGLPFHPDLIENSNTSINAKIYYKSIFSFLSKIKKKYKYNIEISSHPKIEIKKISKYFPGCIIKSNETSYQIQRSSLVITHDSMAINFAVLFKKPVLFITNNILNADIYPHKDEINFFARRLKKSTCNIDDYNIKNLNNEIKVNLINYKNYKKKYITFKKHNLSSPMVITKKLLKDKIWK